MRKIWTSPVKLTRENGTDDFDDSDFEDEGFWLEFGL